MDWTKISTDPNNTEAMQGVHEHLKDIRIVKEFTYLDWVIEKVRGKTCLDIGAIEHDLSYTEKNTWKHKQLVASASKVVGVDIIVSSGIISPLRMVLLLMKAGLLVLSGMIDALR